MRNGKVRVLVAGAEPVRCRVAAVASGRKSSGEVVRNGTAESLRAIPLRQVAGVANCICPGEGIIVVDVAIGASLHAAWRWNNVPAGQRPPGRAVIELAIGPGNRVVAGGAHRSGELRGHVIRNGTTDRGGTVPIRDVAAGVVAIRHCKAVIVADVALRTVGDRTRRRHLMIASQSPAGRSVIPRSSRERGCRRVALRAIRRGKHRTGVGMDGIVGFLPIAQVAAGICTVGRSNVEVVIVVDMAGSAGDVGVPVG
jgi:hypothetical protein